MNFLQDIPSIIKIKDVRKKFHTRVVLDGITLTIPKNSIFCLLGKSGIGKSVLLKCIMNILSVDFGDIWYKHYNLNQTYEYANSPFRDFAYLFQDAALFDFMSVEENIAFPLREVKKIKNTEYIRKRVKELLQWVELPGIEKRMPSELSGGMRKRVGLARTLAMEPHVMLCDEPTTGLDPHTGNAIMKLIQKTNKQLGVTCIIVTHNIPASFSIGDYFAFLDDGKVQVSATKEVFIKYQHPLLQEFISTSFVSKDMYI